MSKWHEFKKQAEADNDNAPVNNAERIQKLYLNTQKGSPVDTVEELDAQLRNPGPKDTFLETKAYNQPEQEEAEHANKLQPK
ncbi:hypothetical protein [Legionella cardiaca]|uniref:Uncharacterized protein n=1 Tax=Legionella cardiaca TaxID=1071983 RepID=A0ABY8AN05_9GAMM|nr:hypothetical protein [Legionella cardiaca]WED42079.1 hypothetical protein PXX05_09045 [Legionella cardiaca]